MPTDIESSNAQEPPDWAFERAADELYQVDDQSIIAERARQIVREEQQLRDERHDEYDDADEGGEG